MEKLCEKVSFLKGLATGLNLQPDTPQNQILLQMLDVLDAVVKEIDTVQEKIDSLDEFATMVSDDLGELEDIVYEQDDEDDDDYDDEDDDDEDYDFDDDEDDDDSMINILEYQCPHCQTSVFYDQAGFEIDQAHICSHCGKELFPDAEQ